MIYTRCMRTLVCICIRGIFRMIEILVQFINKIYKQKKVHTYLKLKYHTLFYCNYSLIHNVHCNIMFYTKTSSHKSVKLTNNKYELLFLIKYSPRAISFLISKTYYVRLIFDYYNRSRTLQLFFTFFNENFLNFLYMCSLYI